MDIKNRYIDCEDRIRKEDFIIKLTDPMLYDRLHILSAEYSISIEAIVNVAVKRLFDDVDFVRNLRIGQIESE